MSARSKNRAPIRARVPKSVRDEAIALTARIADLVDQRAAILKAGAAGLGLDVEKNDYRVTNDWQHYERVVIPLPKQVRRAHKKAS